MTDSSQGSSPTPSSWAHRRLGEICSTASGGTPSRKQANYYGGPIPWIKSGELPDGPISSNEESITEEGLAASSAKIFPVGTLLLAMYGATIGKLGFLNYDAATNQAVCAIFPPSGFSPQFLFYYLLHQRRKLIEKGQGGAQPNISQQLIQELELPVVPSNEQQRIVAKLDELFSQIEKGEENLKRVQALVKQYRQSVLKAAVTGELTRDWREANGTGGESGEELLTRILEARRAAWEAAELEKMKAKGKEPKDDKWKEKYKEPEPPDTSDLPALPDRWVWVSLDQIVQTAQNGLSKRRGTGGASIHVLRLADIENGKIDETAPRDILLNDDELERYRIEGGDLLCIRVNGSQKLTARLIPVDVRDVWAFCDHFIRIQLVGGVVPYKYVDHASDMGITRNHLESKMVTTAGQNTISQTSLLSAPIPLPPLDEMGAIVELIEECVTLSSVVEERVANELVRSSNLRQTVLRAAFSGELVPQDSNDEPASALLERIAVERAASAKKAPKRRAKRKATA